MVPVVLQRGRIPCGVWARSPGRDRAALHPHAIVQTEQGDPSCSLWGFGATSLVLLLLLIFDTSGSTSAEHTTRLQSFIWPLCLTVLGSCSAPLALLIYQRRRQSHRDGLSPHISFVAGLLLVAGESAFLIAAGASTVDVEQHLLMNAPTGHRKPPCRSTRWATLSSDSARVSRFLPPGLGIIPNAQAAYDIRELGIDDPMIPSAYFSTRKTLTNTTAGNPNDSLYCPAIQTVKEARLYGVGFVLEPKGAPGPVGSEFWRGPSAAMSQVANRIPSCRHSRSRRHSRWSQPRTERCWHHGGSERLRPFDLVNFLTNSRSAGDLRLRIVNVPGWHAEVDGRSVPIKKFAGLMMSVAIPPGSHEVRVSYWPTRFTEGLVLAAIAVLIVIAACAVSIHRRTRPHRDVSRS